MYEVFNPYTTEVVARFPLAWMARAYTYFARIVHPCLDWEREGEGYC